MHFNGESQSWRVAAATGSDIKMQTGPADAKLTKYDSYGQGWFDLAANRVSTPPNQRRLYV
jgi:hypothetical protein